MRDVAPEAPSECPSSVLAGLLDTNSSSWPFSFRSSWMICWLRFALISSANSLKRASMAFPLQGGYSSVIFRASDKHLNSREAVKSRAFTPLKGEPGEWISEMGPSEYMVVS